MRTSFGLLLCVIVLAACSDSSDAPSGEGTSSGEWVTNDKRSSDMNRYAEAVCRVVARCGDPAYFKECNANDRATFCGGGGDDTKIPDLEICLKALANGDCNSGVSAECRGARNAQRSGGPSRLLDKGEECGPSNALRCDLDMYCDADPNQCGTCRKLGSEGDACRDTSECSHHTYCANGMCTSRLGAGKTCDPLAFDCAQGLVCADGTCTEQSAEDARATLIGEACDDDSVCYSGMCEDGKCIARTPCGSGQQGDRCLTSAECAEGFVCGGDTRCVAALKDGDACEPTLSLCALGSACFSGTCAPQLKNGQDCEYSEALYSPECASGFCSPAGKCGPPEVVCPSE